MLALSLRLGWPAPPTLIAVQAADFAAFGEHALCLAASAADPAPASRDDAPAPAGDHADHQHSLCCLWHAGSGFVVPRIEAVQRIAFVKAMSPVAAIAEFHPASPTRVARARGPPERA